MTTWTRFSMAGLVALALGGLLLFGGRSKAGDEIKNQKAVQEIADALQEGKMDKAEELAKKLAKKETEDGVYNIMFLMKPRDKKGFGVGKNAGDINPDGIELKLTALGRDLIGTTKLKKELPALEEMAFRVHAISQFSEYLPPTKDKGKATKKKWLELSKEMQDGAVELEKAIKSESGTEIKKAATKVNANCNNCHSIFRG